LGAEVTRFKTGDRVAAIFFQNWISGKANAATAGSALGGSIDGMLSQYVVLNEAGLVRIPEHLSYEEAATLPCAGVTAWNGLVTRGNLQTGEIVLLEGTGGVSIFGLQFAVAAGARALITSSDAKLERAQLGAGRPSTTAPTRNGIRQRWSSLAERVSITCSRSAANRRCRKYSGSWLMTLTSPTSAGFPAGARRSRRQRCHFEMRR
jgi:NADPH:quinone reductase-like Zn-dependent oxidoreductase